MKELIKETFILYYGEESEKDIESIEAEATEETTEGRVVTIGNEYDVLIYADGNAFIRVGGGEWYDVDFGEIIYGEKLTGVPYNRDEINIDLKIDDCKDYINSKRAEAVEDIISDLHDLIEKY